MPAPQRTIGLYALATMSRDGPVHGYQLAERIAERTGGAWRPGAGAIYPALRRLTSRRLARARSQGRRRVYSITPQGRALLARIRSRNATGAPGAPDLSILWAEVAGVTDVGEFLLLRLRRALDAIDGVLASPPALRPPGTGRKDLRGDTARELEARLGRLRGRGGRSAGHLRTHRTGGRRP